MTEELVFYTHPMSRGRIVRWLLEEIGRPYRTELLDYGTTIKAPGYLAVNPMGKVPALRHGDAIVTETAAICAYLADAFPEAGLAPLPGDRLRAPYYRWLFFAAGPLEAAASNRMLGFVVPAEREAMIGYGSYAAVLAAIENAVSHNDYLVGGRFSAADVYLGSHLGFGMQFGTIEKRPAFEAYWQRLAARPAAARARQIDDALLPDHPVPAAPPAPSAATPSPELRTEGDLPPPAAASRPEPRAGVAERPRPPASRTTLPSDPRYPGWVKGWGVVEGDPPRWKFAGIFETRQAALEAAAKAGPRYTVQWGSYDERNREFVSGNI